MNLNKFAAEVAKSDCPPGKNIDIVDVKIVWSRTFKAIRAMDLITALLTLAALLTRAGKKGA